MENKNLLMSDLFVILKELFSGNNIMYVSTPINTGERFIKWYASSGKLLLNDENSFKSERKKYVIDPNIKEAKERIKELQNSIIKIIIDPTNLEAKTLMWDQPEFYYFWDRVIKTLVDEIILLNGWEYSMGCCHELVSALESGITIYNQKLEILTNRECIEMMEKSREIYRKYEISKNVNTLENIIYKVKDLSYFK